MNSETYHYKRGANQQFSQVSHVFDPSRYNDDELVYNVEKETIPIAIHCVVEEGIEGIQQIPFRIYFVIRKYKIPKRIRYIFFFRTKAISYYNSSD